MGARFSAPVQTGPGAHPASCTMGTGSFPGVKSGRGVTLTPSPPSSAVGHERVELNLYSPLWTVWPVQSLSACTRGAMYLNPRGQLCNPGGKSSRHPMYRKTSVPQSQIGCFKNTKFLPSIKSSPHHSSFSLQ